MNQEIYGKMQRQIVPVKMKVSEINGTWKLSQNKPEAVRIAAAQGVAESGIGSETDYISALMKAAKSE